jgi:hypothetical protein
MRRPSPLSLIALSLAAACAETATGPEADRPVVRAPSFQQSQGRQECVGALPPGTYKNVYVPPGAFCVIEGIGTFTIIEGNLTAYEGAFLHMEGVRVLGNLKLMKDTETNLVNSSVGGHIDANGIRRLDAGLASVDGNVTIKNSTGGEQIDLGTFEVRNGDIRIFNNEVDLIRVWGNSFVHQGSLQIRNNTAGSMNVEDTDVAQDVQIRQNDVLTAYLIQRTIVRRDMDVLDNQSPTATVSLNTVTQTLRCFNNAVVFIGGPNVAGNAEGQCF